MATVSLSVDAYRRLTRGDACVHAPYCCANYRAQPFWCELCTTRLLFPEFHPPAATACQLPSLAPVVGALCSAPISSLHDVSECAAPPPACKFPPPPLTRQPITPPAGRCPLRCERRSVLGFQALP